MTSGVKAPSSCSKSECVEELRSFGIMTSNELTLPELRAMVKRNRVELGLMKARNPVNPTIMDQVMKASKRELQALASSHNVHCVEDLSHGDLRLRLRQWIIRQGDEATEVLFGRHVGSTFATVWEQDRQYVEWAVRETATKDGADWKLVQLATWAVMTERVASPFDQAMLGEKNREPSTSPLSLAAILAIDEETYLGPKASQKPPTLVVKTGAESSKQAELKKEREQARLENEDLKAQIALLRQELRALKEERGVGSDLQHKVAK